MPAEIADPAIVAETAEPNREAEVSDAELLELREPRGRSLAGVAESLGIPPDIQEKLNLGEAAPEPEVKAETEPETAEAEAEPEAEEEDEPEAEEVVNDPKVSGLIKAKDKYRHQRNEAREKAADLEKENAELKAKLEDKPPVVVAASWQDPLAHVNNEAELDSELTSARAILSFYRKNPNGWETKDGTIVTPDQVVDKTEEMERIISEEVPRKREELKLKPQFTAQAKALLPTMFDPSHEHYQIMQGVLKETPQLARSPKTVVNIAYGIIGEWYVRQMIAQREAQAKNGGKKINLPPELVQQDKNRGKVPILKSNPPTKVNGNSAPKPKPRTETLQEVIADNSSAALGKALREMRGAGSDQSSRRAVSV